MRIILVSLFLAICSSLSAQNENPVLMTINGTPVTRAEFEYSFNKNQSKEGTVENKTLEEYLPMFIDYKLKVDAAKKAKLDTLKAFKQEFLTYRDMQLTPFLIDSIFIDSVAYSLYDRMVKQLKGKDLLLPSHILIKLAANATNEEKEIAKSKIDSIYQLLKEGQSFSLLAKEYSQDKSTALNGGKLPWIGPGSTFKEFEEHAYELPIGHFSKPFQSPVGFHIIYMNERKPLEAYAQLRPSIISSLKHQGIEEASSEAKINKLLKESPSLKTREELLDSVLQAHNNDSQLKYLIQEYYEGLLLYEISKREVWDKAEHDTIALEHYFNKHKKNYRWNEARYKGLIVHAKTKEILKKTIKLLKKYQNRDWKQVLFKEINKDSLVAVVGGPYLLRHGENEYIDAKYFKSLKEPHFPNYPYTGFVGRLYKNPIIYKDVKSQVLNDVQTNLMNDWIIFLRKNAKYIIDQSVLKTINNH